MRMGPMVFAAVIATVLVGPAYELAAQRQPIAWVVSRAGEERLESAGPFAKLLDHQAELRLSSGQLGRIREIQGRLIRQNEPLLAQLRDAEVWGVQGDEEEAEIAAVRQRFGENALAAEREAEGVLTPEQLERARALLDGASLAYAVPEGGDVTGTAPPDENADGDRPDAEPVTSVTVENFNFYDANIYVRRGAARQRIGFSTGLTTQTFTIPTSMVSGSADLSFEVRPVGRSQFPLSDNVTVHPGDTVVLRIPPL